MNYLQEEDAIQAVSRVMQTNFSDEQLAILRTPGGLSIAAVAGSGKTTCLTALISKRLLTGEIPDSSRILCSTFSKAGAEELEARLNYVTSQLHINPVKVSTLHAICYSTLKHFGANVVVLSDYENYKLIGQAVNEALGRKVYLESEQCEDIASMIGIMDNSLYSVNDLFASGKYILEYSAKEFSDIVQSYRNQKQALGKFTFDDMLTGVYQWLCIAKSDIVIQYIRDKYHYFFLDEFQDTNRIQFEIIKVMLGTEPELRPENRLVVVGDDDQNVYEWRGTDPRIMINIRSVIDIKKMNLSYNYRCKKNIVDHAMNCVRNMGTRQDKTMKSSDEGGVVAILDCYETIPSVEYEDRICKNSQLIVDHITEEMKAMGGTMGPKHYCIMARTNAEMALVANMLLRHNLLVGQTVGMQISTKQAWKIAKKLYQLSKPFNGAYKLQSLLYHIVPYASNKIENSINEVSAACQCSIDYAIEYALRSISPILARAMDDASYMTPGNNRDAGRGISAIPPKTRAILEYAFERYQNKEYFIELINALRDNEALKCLFNLWKTCETGWNDAISVAIKEYLIKLHEELGDADFNSFIISTEQIEKAANPALYNRQIELKTIHGSKGLEWNTVFILNDDNFSFPDFKRLDNLVRQKRIAYPIIKDIIDSERRLHYVAQTRAKNELYLVTSRKFASVFVEETFGYTYNAASKADTDILEKAQLLNMGCDDENGRILSKALNQAYVCKTALDKPAVEEDETDSDDFDDSTARIQFNTALKAAERMLDEKFSEDLYTEEE